jgi:hypothetical protein
MNKLKRLNVFLYNVISCLLWHRCETVDVHFEVPSSNYNNVYFDIYRKKCKKCCKERVTTKPYTAKKCRIDINSKISMDGITGKRYL